MLTIDTQKEIFIRHFIKLQNHSYIATQLNIHRNTVSRICNLQLKKIKELGLCYSDVNLYDYIDKIVYPRKKRLKKINPATKLLIKSIYIENIQNANYKFSKKKSLTDLYNDVFKKVQTNPNSKNKNYNTDISYSCFYKTIQEIKLELAKQDYK